MKALLALALLLAAPAFAAGPSVELVGDTVTAANRGGQAIKFCYRSTYERPVRVRAYFGGTRYDLPALARPGLVECALVDMPRLGMDRIVLEACTPGEDVGCR